MSHLKRPSPALVISILALVAAIVVPAYALTRSEKQVVKRLANGEITRRAPGLAVASANSANTAGNAGTVDGQDASEFAPVGSEAWHEVGTAGEPAFDNGTDCQWSNFDSVHSSAAFVRDASGFVHLKGLVRGSKPGNADCTIAPDIFDDEWIFVLPAGYRPAKREVHATLTNDALGRINVDSTTGAVSVAAPATAASVKAWISIDGISFRCAPPGSNGCP